MSNIAKFPQIQIIIIIYLYVDENNLVHPILKPRTMELLVRDVPHRRITANWEGIEGETNE